jgi:hypothetical protein
MSSGTFEETSMIDLEQKIRERAYQIWEQEGRVHGRDEQHWHKAKLELASVSDDMAASLIDTAGTSAEPAKRGRRTAKPKADAAATVPPAAPRRRRSQAPLQ